MPSVRGSQSPDGHGQTDPDKRQRTKDHRKKESGVAGGEPVNANRFQRRNPIIERSTPTAENGSCNDAVDIVLNRKSHNTHKRILASIHRSVPLPEIRKTQVNR